MNKEQKINYLRIALGLQHISVNNEICDRILTTLEKLNERQGDFSVNDAVEIEYKMDKKYIKEKLEK